MYQALYLKNLEQNYTVPLMPIIEISDTKVDWSELFAQVEYRACIKLKLHFFQWVETTIG